MRNVIVGLFAFLSFSCSTSDDKPSTDVVPLAPTELIGSLSNSTQVTFAWTDNSTNETGFKIERKTGNENYVQIATVGSDITNFSDKDLVANTTYTYRVLAYNLVGNSLTYSNQITIKTPVLVTIPTVTTNDISFITISGALGGGNVTSDGGSTVIARGVVWSTSPNPTIELTTKTPSGTGIGGFICDIGGLKQNTTYFVRAYAANSEGTAYGNQIFFTTSQSYSFTQGPNILDIDGNSYPTIVTSCSQTWMQKNLNVSHYRNGDVIPQVTDPTQWKNLKTGAWCYYANETVKGLVYGKLYNWYAVNDPRGLAPQGWHVPSDEEWTTLTTCLGGEREAGGKMKIEGNNYWNSPNTGATNSSGFASLPGGYREGMGYTNSEHFYALRNEAWFWSSSEYNITNARFRYINYNSVEVVRLPYDFDKKYGFSVRCIKN